MCLQIPKDVAVNPIVAIAVNGAEVLISRGTTLRQVILAFRSHRGSVVRPQVLGRSAEDSALKTWLSFAWF